MPTPPRTAGHHDAPSEYVRLEALAASAPTGTEADAPAPAAGGPSGPLVLVAEADPGLRAWVTLGLAKTLAADAPALRVEAVATAERLIECLQREPVALVLCGHLAPPADWPTVLASLRAADAGACVLVEHTGPGLTGALQERSQTMRLAEAVARLLERTPGRPTGDSTPSAAQPAVPPSTPNTPLS